MNELISICRSVTNSEHAICRLNRAVFKLAKGVRSSSICFAVAGIMMCSVIAIQDKEIRELQKQVSEIAAKTKTHDTTEEQTKQEGA